MPNFPNDWGRRCRIRIDYNRVRGNPTNFPVLLTKECLPTELLDSLDENCAKSDGSDIRFTLDKAGTTKLPREICYFRLGDDTTSGSARIIVLVPTLSSSEITNIYIWYKCPTATEPLPTNSSGKYAVWNEKFIGVWHLVKDENDSTERANHLVVADQIPRITEGEFTNFSSNEYFYIPSFSDFNLSELTTLAVIAVNDTEKTNVINSKGPTYSWIYNWVFQVEQKKITIKHVRPLEETTWEDLVEFSWEDTTAASWYDDDDVDIQCFGETDILNSIFYGCGGTKNTLQSKIFLNGSLDGSLNREEELPITSEPFGLGALHHNTEGWIEETKFNGKMRHVMLANEVLDDDWVKTWTFNYKYPNWFSFPAISLNPDEDEPIPPDIEYEEFYFQYGGFVNFDEGGTFECVGGNDLCQIFIDDHSLDEVPVDDSTGYYEGEEEGPLLSLSPPDLPFLQFPEFWYEDGSPGIGDITYGDGSNFYIVSGFFHSAEEAEAATYGEYSSETTVDSLIPSWGSTPMVDQWGCFVVVGDSPYKDYRYYNYLFVYPPINTESPLTYKEEYIKQIQLIMTDRHTDDPSPYWHINSYSHLTTGIGIPHSYEYDYEFDYLEYVISGFYLTAEDAEAAANLFGGVVQTDLGFNGDVYKSIAGKTLMLYLGFWDATKWNAYCSVGTYMDGDKEVTICRFFVYPLDPDLAILYLRPIENFISIPAPKNISRRLISRPPTKWISPDTPKWGIYGGIMQGDNNAETGYIFNFYENGPDAFDGFNEFRYTPPLDDIPDGYGADPYDIYDWEYYWDEEQWMVYVNRIETSFGFNIMAYHIYPYPGSENENYLIDLDYLKPSTWI